MGTTYEYTYEYNVADSNKNHRAHAGNTGGNPNTGHSTQRTAGQQQSNFGSTSHRTNNNDPLVNLQHDRIWNKLYDPLNQDKSAHGAEIQKMARRQDRKVIKIEAAYGSDRQTFIVKRDYDLRVRDVQEDAAKVFKMPLEEIILYWKGRNICNTPNELLETLGIENNHQMRVCREDDPTQQNRRRELLSNTAPNQQNVPSNGTYNPQQQQQPPPPQPQLYNQYQQQQQPPPPPPPQQQYGTSPPRSNDYYQQFSNQNIPPAVPTVFLLNLQIGLGDRAEGIVIGRPYPSTIYDLQIELQQRFGIPTAEQNLSYNGTLLAQYPPDTPLDSIGIVNHSFVSLWTRSIPTNNQQQQPPTPYYGDGPQSTYNGGNSQDLSPKRMDNTNNNDVTQNGGNPDVLKIEVFHGSDRHILILRSSNNLRIVDLMEELQRITTVPVQNQKLYYRGQELQPSKDRTLRDAGIDNNAQVRLIGDPARARYEPMITGNRPN
ncbi:unnamed protein product [Adineta steineri]|uniref:Ubiquitin-like domain-containing protein n=1 Tax=Adineta steineri TaxID=433720 RepID=A0A818RAY8_9BILA|nr:unnamed protein product [Adineta steineri]